MRCGVALHCMHTADWKRVLAEDWSQPPSPADHELWDEVIELGDMIEPLGYDSIWTIEHFATPYGMVPNALQHLAFWAGRTQRVDMGTCVVVLPWHHPVQVAHEIAMLDILLQGRNYTLGVGRGLSPKEFGPLGIPQEQARRRFEESLDIIKLGLTQERFSYDGEVFTVPETSIRPRPRNADLWQRAMGGFMTETSLEAVAKAGLSPMVISPQSFEHVGRNTVLFNRFREDVGLEPDAQPLVLLWAYCVEKEEDAAAGLKYFAKHGQDGAFHYGFADPSTFGNIKGYEQYAEMFKDAAEAQAKAKDEGVEPGTSQLIGTPDQIIETIRHMQAVTGAREISVNFNFGGIPHQEAVRSLRLFAEEVLPAVHELDATPPRETALSHLP